MTLAKQILADLADVDHAQPIPRESFNDDDWYVYETDSKMLIGAYSGKIWPYKDVVPVKDGQTVARGIAAKYLGIWRIVK